MPTKLSIGFLMFLGQDSIFHFQDSIFHLTTSRDTLKEVISQSDYYLVSLSSKIYVFEDKMAKY